MLARSTRSGDGAHIGSTPTSGLLPQAGPRAGPGPGRTLHPRRGPGSGRPGGNAGRAGGVRCGKRSGNHVSGGSMATTTRRAWLRPPQLRTLDDQGERHATWLELFFDLVFVISIAEVVHTLEDYRSLGDFLGTAGLFVAVWWAWVGYTVYADRFDTDDLLHRALVLAGMLAVIALALTVHDALHGGSAQFALTFVAVRGIVLLLNARARRHAAAARPLLNLYLTAFSIGASLWLVSLLLPEPWRYLLWGVALVVELSAPWLGRRQIVKAPVHASHLVERFGLFTLIVL